MMPARRPHAATSAIDIDRLYETLAVDAASFQAASPFPHVVVDNFLRASSLEDILREFPGPDSTAQWHQSEVVGDSGRLHSHQKLTCGLAGVVGAGMTQLVDDLRAPALRAYLEALTGIAGLVGDDTFHGGLLHHYRRGAYIDVHVDANVQPSTMLDRRLNVILFLNPVWPEAWGGALELWSASGHNCERRLLPIGNRCVIFATTPESYHAVARVDCPDTVTRRSAFVRFYTAGRPEVERRPAHKALWPDLTGAR